MFFGVLSSVKTTNAAAASDENFVVFELIDELFEDTLLEIDPLFTINEVV